jgi:hypothetical protein
MRPNDRAAVTGRQHRRGETAMGYNRAGHRVKKSERRRKKEERRLAAKAATVQSPGLLGTAKRAAKTVAAAVEQGVEKVKKAVTGKGEKKPE